MSRKDRRTLSVAQRLATLPENFWIWKAWQPPDNTPVIYLFLIEGKGPDNFILPLTSGANCQINGPLYISGGWENPGTGALETFVTETATVVDLQGWLALRVIVPQGGALPNFFVSVEGPTKACTSYGRNLAAFDGAVLEEPPRNPFDWEWPDFEVPPFG